MFEVIYRTHDKLVTVLVGAKNGEEALNLVKQSDEDYVNVADIRNQSGEVYFIREQSTK